MNSERYCVAIIGDIVKSRALGHLRGIAQINLGEILERINTQYASAIISSFIITIGDEFQGVLSDATVIPDIIWEIETRFTFAKIRFGIGNGQLYTALKPNAAIGMDGPAWYLARNAIESAKQEHRLGGVFAGFGESEDVLLNGLARELSWHRSKIKHTYEPIVSRMRNKQKQIEIATELGMSRQQVSFRVIQFGWYAYEEGEQAWRTLLTRFNYTSDWRGL